MNVRKALSLAALAAAALAAVPAAAQNWYAGVGAGQGDVQGTDGKETAWQVRGGYMFTPYIGVEAAYFDFGKYDFHVDAGASRAPGTVEVTSFGGALVGVLPFSPAFQGYGRLGYARSKFDVKLNIFDERFKSRDKENGAYYGAGLRYVFYPNMGVFAEYTKHDKIDVQNWMVGVDFRF